MDLIHAAIPVFFTCIALEIGWNWWKHKNLYHYQDSINNLACGSLQQIFEIFAKGAIMATYVWAYESGRLWDIPMTAWWAWAVALLLHDLVFYWFHRASHRINLLWIGHVPHHQSEEFNLTVALRQGMFERIFSWLFRVPMAFLGFSPLMALMCAQIDEIYQFFVHTRLVGRLGFLENWLNTPSNHRVHHGKNPIYIDKNYGGILILWDRLFGTYEPETETPVYGTVSPLASWNPLWANLKLPWGLLKKTVVLERLSTGLQSWFRPPGWSPEHPIITIPQPDPEQKYRVTVAKPLVALALFQFGLTLWSATVFLETPGLSGTMQALWALLLMLSFLAIGAVLEYKLWRWGPPLLLLLALPLLFTGWLPAHPSLWGLLGSGGIGLLLLALNPSESTVHPSVG